MKVASNEAINHMHTSSLYANNHWCGGNRGLKKYLYPKAVCTDGYGSDTTK